jgi:hypothetical protein
MSQLGHCLQDLTISNSKIYSKRKELIPTERQVLSDVQPAKA